MPTDQRLKKLFIVPHSHWDREWYQPFQEFRARLGRMVDKLLATMEADPDFSFFVLDGQTIVLEDYLEIRPENAERMRRLIREGRVLIGPWYVLPDEFLVSGESIVRNLLRGAAICREWGASRMPVGYLPDQFGHIAQMPQVLSRAGLETATLWRGVPPAITESEFRWVAPDGSGVFCVYLSDSYSNGATLPLAPADLGTRLERAAEALGAYDRTGLLLVMNGSDHLEPQPGLPAALRVVAEGHPGWAIEMSNLSAYVERAVAARSSAGAPPLQVWQGELRSPARAPMLVGVTSTRIGQKIRHFKLAASLERQVEPAAAWAWATGSPYPAGELAETWKLLLQNEPHDSVCGCSIDQVHREMETRYDWAGQIAAGVLQSSLESLAARVGVVGPATEAAWVTFNLGGPAGTAVVEGTVQAPEGDLEAVAPDGSAAPVQRVESHETVLLRQTLTPLKLRAMLPLVAGRQVMGYYINGYSHSRVSPDTVEVRLVMGRTAIGELDAVSVRALAAKLLEDRSIKTFRVVATRGVSTRVLFVARDLPALGWRAYRLRPAPKPAAPTTRAGASATAVAGEGLRVTPRSLTNEFFELTVNADGSLRLTDRRTGAVHPSINHFIDSGDAGDEYNYDPPAQDTVVAAPSPVRTGLGRAAVRTAVVESGPARATLEINLVYKVPAALADDRRGRDRRLVDLPVTTRVSLYPGIARVEFVTTVDNRARDHRLRVLFETPIEAASSSAEAQFAVVDRPVDEPGDPAWSEQPTGTKPHKGFVDIGDGRLGLAVLSRGLPEYEVVRGGGAGSPAGGPKPGGSAIALTLLRSVGWLSRDDVSVRPGHAGPGYPTPEAQCLGVHVFEYAVVPHAGTWLEADVPTISWAYTTPPSLVPTAAADGPGSRISALLAQGSFLRVEPSAVRVSAVKRSEDGQDLIVRVFNSSPAAVTARLESVLPVAAWRRVGLLEDGPSPLAGAAQAADLELGAWEIATLRLTPRLTVLTASREESTARVARET